MIVKDDKTRQGATRSVFWAVCLPSPADRFTVLSLVEDEITDLKVGDLVELTDPTHVLWEVKKTDEKFTTMSALYFSMRSTVSRINENESIFDTEKLMPMVKVQITKESEE